MSIRVAVIGAGPAGLAALRHLTTRDTKFTCVAYEMTESIGGTWVYTDKVGNNEFGLPIHSSMYKNLKTNLPPEVMNYPDYPLIADEEYISSQQVLRYLHDYAEHFKLEPYIKFYHLVTNVKAVGNTWEVTVKNLVTKEELVEEFDAVMMCHGHYSNPNIPKLPGIDSFLGETLHSHDYRVPEKFRGKKVVVIGAGFSARDIASDISSVAEKVILSHHMKELICNMNLRENTIQKPDIKLVTEKTVIFEDDSEHEIDAILYCTGYINDFPFLDENCKFSVDENYVQPLYKHMFHIHHPTLCVISLPTYVSPLGVSDLQVRFFLKTLDGSVRLPTTEDMMVDTELEMQWRREEPCYSNRKAHKMGIHQEAYCTDIAAEAKEPRLPAIIFQRFNQSVCASLL